MLDDPRPSKQLPSIELAILTDRVLESLIAGSIDGASDAFGRPLAEGASVEQRRWAYTGSGHARAGDTWLAETGAARAAERRRIARQEVGAGSSVGARL